MLMLDDTRPWNLAFRVVHDRVTLMVLFVEQFALETQGSILESPELVIIVLVNWTAVYDTLGDIGLRGNEVAVFGVEPNLDIAKHTLDHACVATHRNALPPVVEVIVIEPEAAWQALDNARRQILAITPPLLFRIPLDEFLIHIPAYQRQRLLLEIARLSNAGFCNLFGNLGFRLRGSAYVIPHLREGIHVEGEVVQLIFIYRDG